MQVKKICKQESSNIRYVSRLFFSGMFVFCFLGDEVVMVPLGSFRLFSFRGSFCKVEEAIVSWLLLVLHISVFIIHTYAKR